SRRKGITSMVNKNPSGGSPRRTGPPWLLMPLVIVVLFIVALPTLGRYRDAKLLDATQHGDVPTVKRLLLTGGDRNQLLIAAIRRHHTEMVQLLLAQGAAVTPEV